MALSCRACSQVVHETAVICPHCAEHTGVAPDPRMSGAEAVAAVELDSIQREQAREGDAWVDELDGRDLSIIGAAFSVVAGVIEGVKEAVHEREPPIPPAVARIRARSSPPVPTPMAHPEPPPSPGDKPRFLK